jgi:hypothetical protein
MLLPIASASAFYRSRTFTIGRWDGKPCRYSLGKERPQPVREASQLTNPTSLHLCGITFVAIHGRSFPNPMAVRLQLSPIMIGH